MEWITRDGMTFLTPVQDRETKINGICKWEQGFRVYAAIYSKANPTRASVIWQYVYTINSAASSYSWDNVAYYEFTFRQLMAEKPWRNWGKTYAQGWNLALKDPINKSSAYSGGQSASGGNQGQGHDWRDDCCWRYNKNRCKKTAEQCNFDHRCTYCGGWYHSFLNCRKRLHQLKDGNGRRDQHSKSTKSSPNRKHSASQSDHKQSKNDRKQ